MLIEESAYERQLYRINPWWESDYTLEGIYERASLSRLTRSLHTKAIVFLTGLRRIGKTTLMKLLIQKCINEGLYDAKAILYISLDDYILGHKPIVEHIELFRKIHRHRYDTPLLVCIDEITYEKDFEQQLKTIYDTQPVKLFASSSCASLLKERKALLTGRNRTIELLPLGFDEYLAFKQIEISPANSHLIDPYFEDFLKTGGIPEYVLHGEADYLKDMIDDIIMKDIAAMHSIRDIAILRDYFLLLMERAGKTASINKIGRILGIAPDTSRRYFELFADSFLIHPISRHGKTNERLLSPKKIYAADLGIRTFYTGFRDKGSLFENYIFFLLKSRNPRYIMQDGIEIDFFTEDRMLVEVKYHHDFTSKQKKLFDTFEAKKKIVVQSVQDTNGMCKYVKSSNPDYPE